MRKIITWVATFNGANARIYEWDRSANRLTTQAEPIAEAAHRPAFADAPVTTYSSASSARGTGDPKTDAERALEEAYVAKLAAALDAKARLGAFQRLIIAAPPRVLGAFRALAPELLHDKIHGEIGHDYVNTPSANLLERLESHVVP